MTMIKTKSIRIDQELWNKAKQQAKREGKLLEAWIAEAIEQKLKGGSYGKKKGN